MPKRFKDDKIPKDHFFRNTNNNENSINDDYESKDKKLELDTDNFNEVFARAKIREINEQNKNKIIEENDDDEDNNVIRKTKKINKKGSRGRKIFKVILIIFLIIIILIVGSLAGGWIFINGKLKNLKQENALSTNDVGISSETSKELSDYKNYALLGIDSREDDYDTGNRSDCIIIASINQKTGDVKLISVYRDTFLELVENGNKKLDKVTHAYSYGGPQNTLLALNKNLDLNITQYVTVNFDAIMEIVDAVGGVNIDVDSSELKYINGYISENNLVRSKTDTKKHSPNVTQTGLQNLDGAQALAYARIRYTDGGDAKRTERMREVIEAIVAKAKKMNVSELNNATDVILPKINTNIPSSDILALMTKVMKLNLSTSIGFPYTTKGITLDRWYGVPITLEENVKKLHQEIFGQDNYEVPDTVQEISNSIISKTGYSN